ncbi:dolichyl-lipid chaperone [Novymonas esmeraldas]|uniref:Protein RFT1 homolog n=1 Tax=Novymonas esmeraldas TaxID=1808958 RepID=A0AAW0EPW5_9TRYP
MAAVGAPAAFKGQLLLALALNIGLKLITFTLSTLLTRLLLPYQNGIYFTFGVYNDAVLFLAREATRNAASRLPLLSPRDRAEDGDGSTAAAAPTDGGVGHGDGTTSAPATGAPAPADGVNVANVRAVVNLALCSVPLAVGVVVVLEGLGAALGAWSIAPSMLRHARASQDALHKSEDTGTTALPLPSLLPYLPEMTVALCAILMAVVEPCVVLVQSLHLFGVVVVAESAALVARLCTIICIVYACRSSSSSGGGGGAEGMGAEEVVGGGLRTLWEARMALAFGQLAYAIVHVLYYLLVVSGLPVARWLGSSSAMERVRAAAATAGLFPFCLYSLAEAAGVWRRYAVLLHTFLRESVLRLALSEGESFALTSLGSETARGYFHLIQSLGSLVARLLFRVWENACYVKWSRDAALGHHRAAVRLLTLMLRLSFYVAFAFTLLGPPLTTTFLSTMYATRWATPQVSSALQLYFYGLPLLAWNGLLEAYVRAVAAPAVLQRLQQWMVAETVVYVAACYVTLAAFGRADTQGESVSALVLLNVFNMFWRCGVSVHLLVSTPATVAADGMRVTAPPSPSALLLSDLRTLFPVRLLLVLLGLFLCSRAPHSHPVVAIAAVGAAYGGVVLAWDGEVRRLLLAPLWSRLHPWWLRRRGGSTAASAAGDPREEHPKHA